MNYVIHMLCVICTSAKLLFKQLLNTASYYGQYLSDAWRGFC